MRAQFASVLLLMWVATPVASQSLPADVFLRGVPTGQAATTPLALSLADAVRRGLENNLGALIQEQRMRSDEGTRMRTLSQLLPKVSASARESEQIVNLAAFGFTGFADLPKIIGPFDVFDVHLSVSAPIFDAAALADLRRDSALVRAGQSAYKNARELVIVVVSNLYTQAVADASRVASARSQVADAETLYRLAEDQKASGLVAGIDVVRQQVQLEAARQRLIVAANTAEKRKLSLARAIGLPPGQALELTDAIPFAPVPPLTLDTAATQAMAQRDDLKSAEARVEAARAARQAAQAVRLPSLHVDGEYGAVGSAPGNAERTYLVAASLRVPIFQGGDTRGQVLQADAEVRQREAELADLKAGVHYELAAALLDVYAAEAAVGVARNGESLARQQLDQARDRFRAGISSTVELVQAQEALALASDNVVASLSSHNAAKVALARALGLVEERFVDLVKGQQ